MELSIHVSTSTPAFQIEYIAETPAFSVRMGGWTPLEEMNSRTLRHSGKFACTTSTQLGGNALVGSPPLKHHSTRGFTGVSACRYVSLCESETYTRA